jgi:hypothetical protein
MFHEETGNYFFINCTSCLFQMAVFHPPLKCFTLSTVPGGAANRAAISSIITDTVDSGRFSWLESLGSIII